MAPKKSPPSHKKKKKNAGKKGGDEFRKTAQNYDNKSAMYQSKGMSEVASLYSRQADIKEAAAGLADDGRERRRSGKVVCYPSQYW